MAQARTSTSRTGDASGARIGSGARVRGRIHGDGDLVVEGQVEGDLAIRGELTIAEGASVASESIEAQSVVVAGALDGDVAASGTVRLVAGSRVRGNLKGSAVSIEEGARFEFLTNPVEIAAGATGAVNPAKAAVSGSLNGAGPGG